MKRWDASAPDSRPSIPGRSLDPAKYRGGKASRAFGSLADSDLTALFPSPAEQARVRDLVQAELLAWKQGFIGPEGLAVAPRSAFLPETGGTNQDPAAQQAMLQQAGKLCTALGVDAVVFAQFNASIDHPRPATFIVSEGRTDGALTMAATLVVVDRTGRIIVDLGQDRPGDPDRTRDLLPLYKGAGKEAVKVENIDLGDPKKKVSPGILRFDRRDHGRPDGSVQEGGRELRFLSLKTEKFFDTDRIR